MRVTKRFAFSASHRLFNAAIPKKENAKLFGVCNSPHGHNFILDVTVEGEVNPRTGMVINFNELKRLVSKSVISQFDHKDFEKNIPEFAGKVQTAENLAIIIWKKIVNRLPNGIKLTAIRISETNDNWVEYAG